MLDPFLVQPGKHSLGIGTTRVIFTHVWHTKKGLQFKGQCAEVACTKLERSRVEGICCFKLPTNRKRKACRHFKWTWINKILETILNATLKLPIMLYVEHFINVSRSIVSLNISKFLLIFFPFFPWQLIPMFTNITTCGIHYKQVLNRSTNSSFFTQHYKLFHSATMIDVFTATYTACGLPHVMNIIW